MFEYSHPIEWIWVFVTIVDSWASSSSWLAAHRALKRAEAEVKTLTAAERRTRAPMDAVTREINIASRSNAIMAYMLCAAAAIALFFPPPPPAYSFVRQSLWIILLLIGVSAWNAQIAIRGRLVRYRLATGYYKRQATPLDTAPVIADAYEQQEEPKRRRDD